MVTKVNHSPVTGQNDSAFKYFSQVSSNQQEAKQQVSCCYS